MVAVMGIKGSVDEAAQQLAAPLELTQAELRLLLNAGYPAVALVTVDEQVARATCSIIKQKGHAVFTYDTSKLVPSEAMVQPRGFQLTDHDFCEEAPAAGHVQFAAITALIRATHRTSRSSTSEVRERQFRPIMAVASGGLILSKTSTRSVTTNQVGHEQVLYLFSRHDRPWILRERVLKYQGLGTRIRPTSIENFNTLVQTLRSSATNAFFDDRLTSSRTVRGVAEGIPTTDLLAHLLAASPDNPH